MVQASGCSFPMIISSRALVWELKDAIEKKKRDQIRQIRALGKVLKDSARVDEYNLNDGSFLFVSTAGLLGGAKRRDRSGASPSDASFPMSSTNTPTFKKGQKVLRTREQHQHPQKEEQQ